MNQLIKISDEEYFKAEGLSNSYLKEFDKGPKYATKGLKKSKVMKEGLLVHDFILQPEEFYNKYKITNSDIDDARKTSYKELKKQHPDKEIILYDDFISLNEICSNLMCFYANENELLGDIINTSKKEYAMFWEYYSFDGKMIQLKGKMDLWKEYEYYNLILDLKKVQNCDNFEKEMVNYKYYRQAAFYIDGLTQLTNKYTRFCFIPFEMEYPYGVDMYEPSQEYIEYGRLKNIQAIESYINWDGISEIRKGIKVIEKPGYLK